LKRIGWQILSKFFVKGAFIGLPAREDSSAGNRIFGGGLLTDTVEVIGTPYKRLPLAAGLPGIHSEFSKFRGQALLIGWAV
jgi:hypothetical protein